MSWIFPPSQKSNSFKQPGEALRRDLAELKQIENQISQNASPYITRESVPIKSRIPNNPQKFRKRNFQSEKFAQEIRQNLYHNSHFRVDDVKNIFSEREAQIEHLDLLENSLEGEKFEKTLESFSEERLTAKSNGWDGVWTDDDSLLDRKSENEYTKADISTQNLNFRDKNSHLILHSSRSKPDNSRSADKNIKKMNQTPNHFRNRKNTTNKQISANERKMSCEIELPSKTEQSRNKAKPKDLNVTSGNTFDTLDGSQREISSQKVITTQNPKSNANLFEKKYLRAENLSEQHSSRRILSGRDISANKIIPNKNSFFIKEAIGQGLIVDPKPVYPPRKKVTTNNLVKKTKLPRLANQNHSNGLFNSEYKKITESESKGPSNNIFKNVKVSRINEKCCPSKEKVSSVKEDLEKSFDPRKFFKDWKPQDFTQDMQLKLSLLMNLPKMLFGTFSNLNPKYSQKLGRPGRPNQASKNNTTHMFKSKNQNSIFNDFQAPLCPSNHLKIRQSMQNNRQAQKILNFNLSPTPTFKTPQQPKPKTPTLNQSRTDYHPKQKTYKLTKKLRRAWNLNQHISMNVFKKQIAIPKPQTQDSDSEPETTELASDSFPILRSDRRQRRSKLEAQSKIRESIRRRKKQRIRQGVCPEAIEYKRLIGKRGADDVFVRSRGSEGDGEQVSLHSRDKLGKYGSMGVEWEFVEFLDFSFKNIN